VPVGGIRAIREVIRSLFDMDTDRGDWLDQAQFTLRAAEDLLMGGLAEEAISSAFLAMIYAARAALENNGGGISGWEDVVGRFQSEAVPGLSLSKENKRALPIVADLYRRVTGTREMEADPLTATACLEDARAFIEEITARIES
jgi:uncharacterized protein (UPF0332 family)